MFNKIREKSRVFFSSSSRSFFIVLFVLKYKMENNSKEVLKQIMFKRGNYSILINSTREFLFSKTKKINFLFRTALGRLLRNNGGLLFKFIS